MKKTNRFQGRCPLCGEIYTGKNPHTEHHIYYPKRWFRRNIKVDVCHICHQVEFHTFYPVKRVWNESKCLDNWFEFCLSKDKNAYEIYPQLY